MDKKIKELLEDENIQVLYFDDMDLNAFCILETKQIAVNNKLSELEQENAILHELGHLLDGHYSNSLTASCVGILFENKADRYFIEERVKDYFSYYDEAPESISIDRFLDTYHIESKHYVVAEDIIKDYIKNR
jgi:Zn-dependent protease with chaperone function